MNRVFRKIIKQTITVVEIEIYKGISWSYGGSFWDERANAMKITTLKKTRFNYCRDVFAHRHIRLENNTKSCSRFIWRNNLRVYINIKIWNFDMFWAKKKMLRFIWINRWFRNHPGKYIFNARFNYRKNRS